MTANQCLHYSWHTYTEPSVELNQLQSDFKTECEYGTTLPLSHIFVHNMAVIREQKVNVSN